MTITRKHINSLKEDEQLSLVKADGSLLQLIDNQTEKLCLEAIKQNGAALIHVKNPSLKVLLQTVVSWGNISPKYINQLKTRKTIVENESINSSLVDSRHSRIKGWLDDYDDFRKKLTAYSNLSGSKLKSLHNKLLEKYADIWTNKDLEIKERLEAIVCAIEAEEYTETRIFFRDFIIEWFYRQLRAISMLVYLSMNKRRNSFVYEKEAVYFSLLRSILNIPNDAYILPPDDFIFKQLLHFYDSKNEFKTGEELFSITKELSIELFGSILNESEIHEVVLFCKIIDLEITTGDINGIKFLFAKKEEKQLPETKMYSYFEEYARSPQYIVGNAAWANDSSISIRNEALEIISNGKYSMLSEPHPPIIPSDLEGKNEAIREWLNRNVWYQYRTGEQKNYSVLKYFQKDWMQCLIAHEQAHQKIDNLMNPVHKQLRNAFCGDGDNVIYTLRELEADCNGTFPFILSLSEKNAQQAIWVYFFDSWFLHHDGTNPFALMTKVLIGYLLPFCNSDTTINFTALKENIASIQAQLRDMMEGITGKLQEVIERSMYRICDYCFDYQQLEDELYSLLKGDKTDYSREQLKENWKYYNTVVKTLKLFSPEGKKEMEKVLSKETDSLENFILSLANANESASLIDYIHSWFGQFGIFEDDEKTYYVSNNKKNYGIIISEVQRTGGKK